ncbi:MAG TPA: hypothetical protein VFJ58_03290 [Armatimonadota bacterium]|nr:hypothetical protein [Armatimonadota bacterium]
MIPVAFLPDEGGYTSPDRKYLAEVFFDFGEDRALDIYKLERHDGRVYKRRVFSGLQNLNSFAWIRRRPHTLVGSTGGIDYGVGVLALWDGRLHGKPESAAHRRAWIGMQAWWDQRLLRLRRARYEEGEGFVLLAVSADGHAVRYEHFSIGENSPEYAVTHTIRLPPR